MYENLLANVPTELWIGGEWREASDGARFASSNPATEEQDRLRRERERRGRQGRDRRRRRRRSRLGRGKAARAGRDPPQGFRTDHGEERLARLITIENGKALPDSRAEIAYAAEFFRWSSEEAVRAIGDLYRGPASGARIVVDTSRRG